MTIDILVLMIEITVFARLKWYKTLGISLGAVFFGIVTVLIGGRLDPFDLGTYVH